MENLLNILNHGNAADAEGSPVVQNWPQVRGAILLIGRAFDLATITPANAAITLPAHHDALDANAQQRVIAPESYHAARREVLRLLALYGGRHDPWDALMAFVRKAERPDIENCLYYLRAPARTAGLTPAQITTDWFNERDKAASPGLQRNSLRNGATAFNKLFNLPDVAASGILPPAPIGPFLEYDKLGRPLCDLPPLLLEVRQHSSAKGAISSMWQAICMSGRLKLPPNPQPADILDGDTWERINGLEGALIGVSDETMRIYRGYLRRGLENILKQKGVGMDEHKLGSSE